jgi:hypothetical protein
MSQSNGIPLELYRPIFQHVTSKSTLCALATLSPFTQVEVERLLYRELEGISRLGVLKLFQRILNVHRIVRYVRSIQIWDSQAKFDSMFFLLVAQALARTEISRTCSWRPTGLWQM